MMAFSPLIYDGENLLGFMFAIVTTIALIVAFAGAIEGRLIKSLSLVERAVLLVVPFALIFSGLAIKLAAVAVVVVITSLNAFRGRERSTTAA